MNAKTEITEDQKIVLALLPFWTPLIPPLGIGCLKAYLEKSGYRQVLAVDVNVELGAREYYEAYFNRLSEEIPPRKRGNFFNTGRELLRNHLMAQWTYSDETAYSQLVREMVYKSYYVTLDSRQVEGLNRILADFYTWLREYFLALLDRENPAVLGLSVYSGTLPASLFIFKLVKENYPQIRCVMGGGVFADQLCETGPNFAYFLETAGDYIDTIIIGEGERLFHRWLKGAVPPGQRILTRRDLDGGMLELSSAPLPALGDFPLEKYPYMVSYTSRSCPFQCSFCSETLQWGKYRLKKPQQVVTELKALYQAHGNQLFLLCDSLINPVITPLAREFVHQDLSLYWESCLRVEGAVCNTENTLLWRQGGFYKARLGIESGSQKVLDLMNKKITPAQAKEAVRSLAYAGIKVLTFWIIGHPGESDADFQQTLDLLTELKDDIYEAEGTPFLYFPTGQSHSDDWFDRYPRQLLYSPPAPAREMLVTQTWILEAEPSREETYRRVNRFIAHLDKLGIPHPYTLQEIYRADERWKKLHPNAAPDLMAFEKRGQYIDENRHVKPVPLMRKTLEDDGEFEF
jgi:radical SAM superfamily enzyme YgiQ (UPF0313 family)